jgi:protein SCO1/2
MRFPKSVSWALMALLAMILSAAAHGGYNRPAPQDAFDPGLLRIEEGRYLGQVVPDVAVRTESGTARLHSLVAAEPTILLFAYYTCHGPCPTTIRSLWQARRAPEDTGHRVLVLSFDRSDTLENLRRVKSELGPVPASWTFGILPPDEIERLTRSVGFTFFFSERDRSFLHPTVLVFLSPRGEVMRYLYGTELRARDLELALIESRNRVPRLNELVDMVKLTCYRFDPARSRYVLHPAFLFGGIGLGVLGATGLIAFSYGRNSHGGRKP